VIPQIDEMFHRERFDVREIHDHAAIRRALGLHEIALQRDLQHVSVAVEIAALAAVIGDAVARVEFEFSGNRLHVDSVVLDQGIFRYLCVCIDRRHFGWRLHQSIASFVLISRDGPSMGCTRK
jgi:hypothetical protein